MSTTQTLIWKTDTLFQNMIFANGSAYSYAIGVLDNLHIYCSGGTDSANPINQNFDTFQEAIDACNAHNNQYTS